MERRRQHALTTHSGQMSDIVDHVKFEQIRILHSLSTPTYALTFGVALVLAYAFRDFLGITFVSIWLVCIAAANLSRYLLGMYFIHRGEVKTVDLWAAAYCLGTFWAGCNWGAFVLHLDASWPSVFQLIMITSIAGMIAGAVSSHACYFPALASFYSPILISVIAVSIQQDDQSYMWLIPLVLFFWAVVHIAGQRFANMLTANIRMQQSLSAANEKLELLSRLDSLTQLQNRGALESYLSEIWSEHRETQRPVSIAMIDVDFFKAYNDHYGHVQGDQCLTHLANILRIVVPEGLGFVGRYGGEEFIVVLPGYSISEAKNLMKRAQQVLEREEVDHARSTVSRHLTISIGVESAVPLSDDDWLELIDRADAKLYIAKQRGRNQIV